MLRHLLVPLAALALPAHAADLTNPADTLLTLTAEGRSTRVPDIAVLSAGVVSTGRTAGAAMAANAGAMAAALAALKSAGVADRDIQTSTLSLSPSYADRNRPGADPDAPPRIIGYTTRNSLTIRMRDIARAGAAVDALVAAGANDISGPSFALDAPAAARDEARIAAMKEARARADLYARAAGLHVVRIVTISEGEAEQPRPMQRVMVFARVPTAIAAGEVDIVVPLTVGFELAPGG